MFDPRAVAGLLAAACVAGCGFSPYRTVTIPDLEFEATEVTVAQYGTCVEKGACSEPRSGDFCNWGRADRSMHPINCVSEPEAAKYCAWAGGRLPTAEEWEYAARTDGYEYPWIWDPVTDDITCWKRGDRSTADAIAAGGTCAVATHPKDRNKHGLYDVAGNVREWTQSRLADFYPLAAVHPDDFLVKGGSFANDREEQLYVSLNRHADSTDDVGFRCVYGAGP